MLGTIFKYGITGLFLLIDGIVYFTVAQLFHLYEILARSQILQDSFIEDVANRIYVVIGIFMLFFVTYSLLKSLVNPDNMKDTSKIASNIVISLILISLIPAIFFYARELQTAIIDQNIIGKLVLGEKDIDYGNEGNDLALMMLETFLEVPDDAKSDIGTFWSKPIKLAQIGKDLLFNQNPNIDTMTWKELRSEISSGNIANFLKIGLWGDTIVTDDNASYIPIISTFSGAFLLYVILSFCIDLGIRVIKLAFYQIIAPIPILMRILPNKKSVFDNWVKATLATYMEVFVRIFIMVLIVFIASSLMKGKMLEVDNDIGVFGIILVILGLFAFAKQAPKLISNVIGIDSGNLKLGIGGKLDASGPLGKAINYIGKGTFGALTGGLGGAYGAFVNGAGSSAGFLYGAINGWKGKKGQFSRQRQGVYSDVLEQKGSAGWFGGRGIIDNIKENQGKEALKKRYLESEEASVRKVEESEAFKKRQKEIYQKTEVENAKKYNELSKEFMEKMHEFESDKQSKLKTLMEKMQQEQQAFEKDRDKKQKELQLQLADAQNNKDLARQTQLLSQLANLENTKYSNAILSNQINLEQSRTSTKELDSLAFEMEKVRTVDEDAIFKATQKEFKDANSRYKTSSKYVAQKAAEKAAKKWREDHADEAAIQESIYENAFKSASKGGSSAGFGGSTGGASKSSSDSSKGSSSSK